MVTGRNKESSPNLLGQFKSSEKQIPKWDEMYQRYIEGNTCEG